MHPWLRSLGWGDSPGGGNGNPLQYSCLENPMDRGVWWPTACGVAESDMTQRLSTHMVEGRRRNSMSFRTSTDEYRMKETMEWLNPLPASYPPAANPSFPTHTAASWSAGDLNTHTQPCRSPTCNSLMAFNLPLNKFSRISPQLSYWLVVICLSFHVTACFLLLKTPASTMYSYLLVSLIPFPRLAAEWGVFPQEAT